MLIKGTEDLRIQKTMAAIKESFEALICEKDYNDIKVTELCARAKINKKTFYHYYPTLDDLLSEMQMEMSAAYIEMVKDYKLPEDAEKVNRIFFEYSAAQGLAYEKITCSSGSYSVTYQQFWRQLLPPVGSGRETNAPGGGHSAFRDADVRRIGQILQGGKSWVKTHHSYTDGSGNDNLTLCLFFRNGAEYGAAGEHTGSDICPCC